MGKKTLELHVDQDYCVADYIIYDGKFYVGDSQIDSFDYQSDIVNSDLESLM